MIPVAAFKLYRLFTRAVVAVYLIGARGWAPTDKSWSWREAAEWLDEMERRIP